MTTIFPYLTIECDLSQLTLWINLCSRRVLGRGLEEAPRDPRGLGQPRPGGRALADLAVKVPVSRLVATVAAVRGRGDLALEELATPVLDPVLLVVHLARVGHHGIEAVVLRHVLGLGDEAEAAAGAGAVAHVGALLLLPDPLLTFRQRFADDDEGGVLGDERVVGVEELVVLLVGDLEVEVGRLAELLEPHDGALEVDDGDVEAVDGQRRVLEVVLEFKPHGHGAGAGVVGGD